MRKSTRLANTIARNLPVVQASESKDSCKVLGLNTRNQQNFSTCPVFSVQADKKPL
jgi:hypothetical protein